MQIVIEITDRMYEAIKQDHVPIDIGRFIRNGIPLPKDNKCKWIHYDYRTVCPGEHDIDNPY